MQIDLSWLKLHLKETESFHLEQDLGGAELIQGVKFLDVVTVDLDITNTGRLMVGRGEIKADLEIVCDRCLKVVKSAVTVPFTVELCAEENRAHFKNEESFIYFDAPQVDIKPAVLENIILSLPIRTICSDECLGLCSSCGFDLNQGKCNCQGKEIDPRWDALKKML